MISIFGPPNIYLPIVFTSVFSLALCIWALHRGLLIETFPSLVWLSLMQVPFILNSGGVSPAFGQIHMAGVGLFSIALLIGDSYALHKRTLVTVTLYEPKHHFASLFHRIILIALCALVVLIPVYHLMHAPTVPLLMLLSGAHSEQTIVENREAFAKLLEVPTIMKYAFNWVMTVFGPILVFLLLRAKRPVVALLIVVWLIVYSMLSTAKAPLVIFLLVTLAGTVPLWKPQFSTLTRYLVFSVFILMMASGVHRANELVTTFNESLRFEDSYATVKDGALSEYPERGFGLSDIDRFREASGNHPYIDTYKYLVYRVVLTPVEVSYHWYTFFPMHSGGWRSLEEIVGKRDLDMAHAANRVGLWAYKLFFPTKYGETISAYASADADAYAFGGLLAVAIAASIFLVIRISIVPIMSAGVMGKSLGMMMLVFLGYFPSSASMQAIFVAQGFILLLLLGYVIAFLHKLAR